MYTQLLQPNFPADVGYYAGYLVSLFFLGQVPGSVFWGWFADCYGRRTTMIVTSIGNVVCLFSLGLSKNYYVSLVIRLLHGLIDGGLGVSKTIMADLCTDSNITIGTGMIFVGGAVGGFVGPLLGGYLSKKEAIQPFIKLFPFLKELPYMLPFSVCALLYILVLVMFTFWAEETLSEEEMAESKKIKAQMTRELSSILRKTSSKEFTSHEQLLLQYNTHSGYSSILHNRDLLLTVAVYGLVAGSQTCYDTIYPLMLMNPKRFGGFDLDAVTESWISTVGITTQVGTLVICPIWSKLTPYRIQCLISVLIFAAIVVLSPLTSYFNNSSAIVQSLATLFPFAFCVFIRCIAFKTYKEFRATAMGLGQMFAGLFRFLGPFFVPSLFSWSTNFDRFPINYGFSFYLIGIILIIDAVLCYKVSPETDCGKGSVHSTIKHRTVAAPAISDDELLAVHV
ncbi:MFS general substrate transporter [Blastocystis sp. subtype 4]|uniref:MFS general substrate transporter n=1 Tax=Blastocystis sp. subtype 4 TaxID=944170 RepID=UPI000711F716|nr:MFS general substrate transporter [Blastocystis sp. subtype 4]KNB43735.1 MFS general substrate transporter [Blastocystis sp. subtype 4]|eukprot:XP_014527178.1 MFS general substrate transporter [Blastocystis sp. subtype 4]